MKKVAIIGAGASGIFCAIECAKNALKVDIYEQNSKPAKKILVSGNGKCNISNQNISLTNYFSQNIEFVRYPLERFGFKEFQKYVKDIGLLLDVVSDGRAYPMSYEAKSVVQLFINYAKSLGVNFITDKKIKSIKPLFNEYFSVIVATGSEAGEHLGGCDDGYKFAKEFNHNIVPTYPILVQLHLKSSLAKRLSGIKIDAEVTLLINNQKELTIKGDVLFTNYGISGFAILDISYMASEALLNYQMVDIVVNILPSFTIQTLSKHIHKQSINLNLNIEDILIGILSTKIVKNILQDLNIDTSLKHIDVKIAKKIANKIINLKFEVETTHGFRYAEASGGGVDTTQINPKTLESKNKKNLYFIGEVLDVVGSRGGYNFAWAWASGFVCAKSISKT